MSADVDRSRCPRKNSGLRRQVLAWARRQAPSSPLGQAIERFLLEDSGRGGDVVIDWEIVSRYSDRISTYPRSKGVGAGETLKLQAFQLFILVQLIGRRRGDFAATQLCLVEMGRGNGKTELLAAYAVARCELSGNPEDVRFIASAYRQAEESWTPCKAFGREGWVHGYRDSRLGASCIRPMAAKVPTLQGLTPSLAIADEAARHRDKGLDVLVSALGKRPDAQLVCMTTPDPRNSRAPYAAYRRRAIQELAAGTLAPHWAPVLFQAGPDDAPEAPATWKRANPGMGTILAQESLRHQFRTLYPMGGEQRQEFLEQHLCRASVESVQMLDMADYRACVGVQDWASLAGRPAIVALDMACGGLSDSIDLISLAWGVWADNTLVVGMRHLLPAGNRAAEIGRKRGLPLSDWLRTGAIRPGGQEAVDFGLVTAEIAGIGARHQIKVVAVDPVNRQAADIEREWMPRWPVEQVPQKITFMAPYWAQTLDMLRRRQLLFAPDPVLEASFTQTRAVVFPSGLVRPVKDVAHGLSDPVMALCMLVGVAGRHKGAGDYSGAGPVVC